ncbi:hypothetical protein FOZ76_24835 [Verticiella sediminum]|uniref:DUF4351 domain-containing protein n=1 Tax=Verticiella sediminum TaxID=1247510 RepID=A0A556A7I8_9BURK|nr:hypothetical protein [Verticiella sediminum]TSH88863.1 hypothetical protein FOZ76_24835 [Verticiella sediminum]
MPQLHGLIDWSVPPRFLDKELQRLAGARRKGRRHVDKLAELVLAGQSPIWILLHVEVQGAHDTDFARRMFVYYYRLRERHPEQPIAQIAILTRSTGRSALLLHRECALGPTHGELRLTFPVIHLQHWRRRRARLRVCARTNPFAVAILAELEAAARTAPGQRLRSKRDLVRLLYEQGHGAADVRRLFAFIDGVLTLPPDDEERFARAVIRIEEKHNVTYITSIERVGFRKGLAKGLEQGLEQGRDRGECDALRGVLALQLTQRFGALPSHARERLDEADAATLRTWTARVFASDTLAEALRIDR